MERVKSFKRISDNAIFTNENINDRRYISYNNTNGVHSVKYLEDFLCDSQFMIHSVIQNNTDIVFTIEDSISETGFGGITHFKFELGEIIVFYGIGSHSRIKLTNTVKYIVPTPNVGNITTRRTRRREALHSFSDIQTEIENNLEPIRLARTLKSSMFKLGLEAFLVRFFKELNNERETIFVDSGEVQCEVEKRRSLGDIYMICKYYFPDCTIREVIELLYIKLPTIITDGFRTSKCNEIHKRVFYYSEGDDNGAFDKTSNDEYHHIWSYYINLLNETN